MKLCSQMEVHFKGNLAAAENVFSKAMFTGFCWDLGADSMSKY